MRVMLCADASLSVGVGHVMRCWALAEEFAAHGYSIAWSGEISVGWVKSAIAEQGWVIECPESTADLSQEAVEADLVVVDSYSDTVGLRESLTHRGVPVIAIVDGYHQDAGPASMWVNPGAPCSRPALGESRYLNGPDFVLLRRDIRHLRDLRSHYLSLRLTRPSRTMITCVLGGTDFANLASTVRELQNLREQEWDLVAGPGRGTPSAHWLPAGPELMKRAALADLVVSPAGVSSWEMAHIGVPMGLILAADNQQDTYAWMTGNGLAEPLGEATSLGRPSELARAIDRAVSRADAPLRPEAPEIDGLGARRVLDRVVEFMRWGLG